MPTSSTAERDAGAALGLPQRAPFVFVRQLLGGAPGRAECATFFASDEPFFAGHFPGNPVVPGVILTEALAQTAGIAAAFGHAKESAPRFLLSAIRGMKFFAPARPNEQIHLRAEKLAEVGGLLQFQVAASVAGKIVAEGQIVLNVAAPAPQNPPG